MNSDYIRLDWDDALLFRTLATLRAGTPEFEDVQDLLWQGPRAEFEKCCRQIRPDALWKSVSMAKFS